MEMGLLQKLKVGELEAGAQGGQEGAKLGVHDATVVQVQVLQGGRGPLDQDLQGLQAGAGQVDPAEAQVLQQADARALRQVRQV